MSSPSNAVLLGQIALRVPPEQQGAFFKQALDRLGERPDLAYERALLQKAIGGGETPQGVIGLFGPTGRLAEALASQAVEMAQTLGVSTKDIYPGDDVEDIHRLAEQAWEDLKAGAGYVGDFPSMITDPVGVYSGGAIYWLIRQGLAAWGASQPDRPYPPHFGFLSPRGDPTKLEVRLLAYNRHQFGKLGDVSFSDRFPADTRMVILPDAYRDLLRRRVGIQVVNPASKIMAEHCNAWWADLLPHEATVVTGVKGYLPDGSSPSEHIKRVLQQAHKKVHVLDVFGYIPSQAWIEHIRDGKGQYDQWEVVLACESLPAAREFARMLSGPGVTGNFASYRDPKSGSSVTTYVIENHHFNPPLRLVLVWDPDVIRACEIASIEKNLIGPDHGRKLCYLMCKAAESGKTPFDQDLINSFETLHAGFKEAGEEWIRKSLAHPRNKIAPHGRILLPGIVSDLLGSWQVSDYFALYSLIYTMMDSRRPREDRIVAMVHLHFALPDICSVRNLRTAFAQTADLAVARRGLVLMPGDLMIAVERLRRDGLWNDHWRIPVEAVAPHSSFTISDGGTLEGVQTAAAAPQRYGREGIPVDYRALVSATLRTDDSFMSPQSLQDLVELTRRMSTLVPFLSWTTRSSLLGFLRDLEEIFNRANETPFEGDDSQARENKKKRFIEPLIKYIQLITTAIGQHREMTSYEVSWVNQALLEVIGRANLLSIPILTNPEVDTEWQYIDKKLQHILDCCEKGDWIHLFSGVTLTPPETASATHGMPFAQLFYKQIGEGLIELTYTMSQHLNDPEWIISQLSVQSALREIIQALEQAKEILGTGQTDDEFLLGVIPVLRNAYRRLSEPDVIANGEAILTYAAIIDDLLHSRRILVFGDQNATLMEMRWLLARFKKIPDYLADKRTIGSPLTYHGRPTRPPTI